MQLMCGGIYKNNYKYKQPSCKFFDMRMTVLCILHIILYSYNAVCIRWSGLALQSPTPAQCLRRHFRSGGCSVNTVDLTPFPVSHN